MKRTILSAAMLAACSVSSVWAQSNQNAISGSNSTSGSTSGSAATGGAGGAAYSVNAPAATALSNQTTNSTSGSASYGNVGNTTTNTMNPTAASNSNASTRSNSSAMNAGNSQSNGSASMAGGGSAGATGGNAGATGGNVTATIAPTTTIQFNTPPTQRVESASDTSARILQENTGTTEQILSGTRTDRIEYSGTTTVKNVPSMNAPPLTSSNDTCMGSWSAGVAVAGFGASGGNTYTDEHCKRIKMSRELWNKGMKAASLALDCMDRDAREALEITGFVCPQTTRAQQRAGVPLPTRSSVAATVVTPVVATVTATNPAVTTEMRAEPAVVTPVLQQTQVAPAPIAPIAPIAPRVVAPEPVPAVEAAPAAAAPAPVLPVATVEAPVDPWPATVAAVAPPQVEQSQLVRVLRRPVRTGEFAEQDDLFVNR
jgi:hypothetical protein